MKQSLFLKRMDRYGELFSRFALSLKPRERVFVHGESQTMPLIEAFVRHALRAGAHPTVKIEVPEVERIIKEEASLEQLCETDHVMEYLVENFDARFKIFCTDNPYPDARQPSEDRFLAQQTGRNAWYSKMLAAQARKKNPLKWTCGNYPCPAFAMRQRSSLNDYAEMVFRAAHCDKADPVAANEKQEKRMLQLRDRLEGCSDIRIVAPETDLRMKCTGRLWSKNFDRTNIPGSEVATSPLEDSAEGHITFHWPQGRFQGIHLVFEKGRCVRATCEKGNEEELQRLLNQDKGARLVGEFAFGLNNSIKEPCGDTLFDEKIGGSIHIALGASYAELGGKNTSNLHWDLVCNTRDKGEVWIDDVLLMKNGKLLRIDD